MSEHTAETGDTLRGYVPPSLQEDGYDENDQYRGYVPGAFPSVPSSPATPSSDPDPTPEPAPDQTPQE